MDAGPKVVAHPTAEWARLRAELAELQQRDAHLRYAMEASNVVAYQWDITNDRVIRLRSSSAPGSALESPGNFESVVAQVLPEDQQRFRNDIAAALASPQGLYRTELRYRRADGEIRWISESGRLLRDADGRPVSMVGVTFDITDRKCAEEALQRAQAELREQSERKDEFLAVLAHELRNPLAPIRNAVQILRMTGGGDSASDKACGIIERQLGQLVRLVDDLLDVSRISRGKISLQRNVVDLREVARLALDTSQSLLSARRHAVQLALPAEPVLVEGDAARLAQIVTNLLNNAAKYTDQGGRVELTLRRSATEAVLAVQDNGCGLDTVAQQRVFDMFYQVEQDLERSQGGLGLGLALVKRLVDLHGGTVSVHSAGRGYGSVFSVNLPLAVATASASEDHPDRLRPGQRPLRVLVVDDVPDAADSMAAVLRLEGHEVHTAHDGKRALELALSERPDLVLLDIGLPVQNGYEACRAMRQGGLTDALVVAVSGHGHAEARRLSQVAGFDDHLLKPVDYGQLQALLERCAVSRHDAVPGR